MIKLTCEDVTVDVDALPYVEAIVPHCVELCDWSASTVIRSQQTSATSWAIEAEGTTVYAQVVDPEP